MKKLKILYVRVSSLEQNSERQKINEKEFDLVIEDKISGATNFFERPGGREILGYIDKDMVASLSVHQIDRLGRNLKDIINTIDYFKENKICIHFLQQSLKTLDENGKENAITSMIISILGVVAQMERVQLKERQLEGIRIAKLRGVYTGRKSNTKEDTLRFLSKTKNKKAIEYLKKGYKAGEAAKLSGIHANTVTKIRKLANI
jgi:DNA invertase Pin-like site-specific DNA recombinase